MKIPIGQHSQAWELIQKRQKHLDKIELAAKARQAEFERLSKDVDSLTLKRGEALATLKQEAADLFLQDNASLVSHRRKLKFEVRELEKQHKDLADKINFSWAEHRDLVQSLSNLNTEVSYMVEEARAEAARYSSIQKQIDEEIARKLDERANTERELEMIKQDVVLLEAKKEDLLKELVVNDKDLELKHLRSHDLESEINISEQKLAGIYGRTEKALKQLNETVSKDKDMREALADQELRLGKARKPDDKYLHL